MGRQGKPPEQEAGLLAMEREKEEESARKRLRPQQALRSSLPGQQGLGIKTGHRGVRARQKWRAHGPPTAQTLKLPGKHMALNPGQIPKAGSSCSRFSLEGRPGQVTSRDARAEP